MASSPTPSLDSSPGANSIGSFEHNDYLSDSPLTVSGSSPPVSDSAISDEFTTAINLIDVAITNQANSQSIGPIGGGQLVDGQPRCTGCKGLQSDAVAKCVECANYLCSNCVTAHEYMHCFEGHSVFRISEKNGQSRLANIINGLESHRIALGLKDDISKFKMNSILSTLPPITSSNVNVPPPNGPNGGQPNGVIGSGLNGTTLNGNSITDLIQQATKSQSAFGCTRHKNELLKFYCRTCTVAVCKDCIVIDHPNGLHDIVNDICHSNGTMNGHSDTDTLLKYVDEIRQRLSEVETFVKTAEHNSQRTQLQYIQAQNDINETHQFYRSMLDERKQELLKELENFHNAKSLSQSMLLTKSKTLTDQVLNACKFVENYKIPFTAAETATFRKVIEAKLQPIIPLVQELQTTCELDFVSNYQAIQVGVRNTFGYIRSNPEQPTKQPPIARPTTASMNGSGSSGTSSGNGNSPSSSSPASSLCAATQSQLIMNGLNGLTGHSNGQLERTFSNGSSSIGSTTMSSLSSFDSNIISKRFNGTNSLGPFISGNDINLQINPYEKWSTAGSDNIFNSLSDPYSIPISGTGSTGSTIGQSDSMVDLTARLMSTSIFPPKSQIKRQKMIYHCKFGEFGVVEGQFTEPSGVAVNAQNDIIVADTNNHRIQIFDKEGRFKFQFGECGKRDGQLLYPNRVAVMRTSGDIIVTERSPTHQIQIYNQYGQFVRKFGATILQHPRGVTVDNKERIIVVECKVMRVIIFDQTGNVLQKFGCSKHLEFPNGVVVNDKQEIFISDNRAHCVKVFNYDGVYLRQIGGEGITNYPIGVGINMAGEILIADNHNNFNLTIFTQDGQLVSALESKVKHAQCFDVALMDDGSVVLASKDYRLYIYRYVQVPPLGL